MTTVLITTEGEFIPLGPASSTLPPRPPREVKRSPGHQPAAIRGAGPSGRPAPLMPTWAEQRAITRLRLLGLGRLVFDWALDAPEIASRYEVVR